MLLSFMRNILDRKSKAYTFSPFDEESEKNRHYHLNKAGLYIHVPFCRKLCDFCPYYKIRYDKELADSYVQSLLKELELVKSRYSIDEITSVYYGGGTPALLGGALQTINRKICDLFAFKGAFAIELHPENLTQDTLSCLTPSSGEGREPGHFSMASVGIQSFNEQLLRNLGRNSEKNFFKALRILTPNGKPLFKTIDIDLIFGIPGQTPETLADDFSMAVEAGATQISTYPFIDFSYTNTKHPPVSPRMKKKLLRKLVDTANSFGFERGSVWTFRKPDTEKYSSVTRDFFVGLGPSAVTLTMSRLLINTFSVEAYCRSLASGSLPAAMTLEFSKRSRMVYWVFWNCYERKLNDAVFHELFKVKLKAVFGFWLNFFSLIGLIKKDTASVYRLTDRGAYYYHLIEQELTHAYIDTTWKNCARKSWPESFSI
jgi:oxygen-independent coproporphyrinogen-3 oxidase